MENFDCLIIGGGVAGTNAAETFKKNNPTSSVAIITDEPVRLYSRVLLPKFMRGQVDMDHVFLRKDQDYLDKGIILKVSTKVISINIQTSTVATDKGEIGYKKLLIASGGEVRKLDLVGSDLTGVFYFRTNVDSENIKNYITGKKNAIVIGGGFIGLELAQTFKLYGLNVRFLILEEWFWQNLLGEESGKLMDVILKENGLVMSYSTSVAELKGQNGVLTGAVLKSGEELLVDVCGIGVGINPRTEFVSQDITTNKGRIVTNEFLQTNIQNVWAAGDVAEFWDLVLKMPLNYGNWVNASEQGRIVGENMSGKVTPFKMVSAYSISIFGNNFTTVGTIRKDLAREIVVVGMAGERKVVEVFLGENNRVLGATLINRGEWRGILTKMIESGEIFDRTKLV